MCWWTASRFRGACSGVAGFYFFPGAKRLMARGSGPYFYLPKMGESRHGTRLWNDILPWPERAGRAARHDPGDRADETILASFEMDERFSMVRDHSG